LQSQRPPFSPFVHGLAVATTAWTVLAMTLGVKTKSQEAGLTIAEPFFIQWKWDWLFVPNLNAEYSHRVLVGVLGVLTLLLAGALLAKDSRAGVKKLAVWLVIALLAQAVLGYMTVKYFARASTSIPHAVLGQIFLALATSAAVVTSRYWLSDREPVKGQLYPPLYRLCRALVIMLFVQLLLGAAIRHDNRGEALVAGREMTFIWHLVAHVMGALGVAFFLVRVVIRINRHHKEIAELRGLMRTLMVLLGLQILLGTKAAILKLMTIAQADAPPTMRVVTATLHVLVGAGMLAAAVALMLRAKRLVTDDFAPLPSREAAGAKATPGAAA
jgi:heme a synthase